MILSSLWFFLFLSVMALLYYSLLKRFQWILLLIGSIFFYLFSGLQAITVLIFATAFTVYLGAYAINYFEQKSKAVKEANDKLNKSFICRKKIVFVLTLLLNFSLLGFFKYYNFFIDNINPIIHFFHITTISLPLLKLILPLGISFYTFQTIGYLTDVYRDTYPPQKNPVKFLLFTMFFPTVSLGPIHRYPDLAPQLFSQHKFDWTQFTFGIQRILWGLFKKLVIADRLAMFVNPVYDNYVNFSGGTLLIAVIFYAFQLYADFSGCMDIVIGSGQIFGIKMTENFRLPYFSRSIREYWQRWHITLGSWLRDYLFYPLSFAPLLQKFREVLEKFVGRKHSTFISSQIAMFILWFAIGFWHGADWKFIIGGGGLLCWFYITLGEVCKPINNKILKFLQINTDGVFWKIFQVLRTFILMQICNVFFRANSMIDAINIFKKLQYSLDEWIMLGFFGFLLFVLIKLIIIRKPAHFLSLPIIAALICGISIKAATLIYTLSADLLTNIHNWDFRKYFIVEIKMSPYDFLFGIMVIVFLIFCEFMLNQKYIENGREWISKQPLPIRWTCYMALSFLIIMFGIYGGLTEQSFIYQQF
jgi:D-alanyl-lipoteichoic acid acyltransferase DltB (MBOAT superfamily)